MMIECTKRMVDVSRGEGIETIIVDTTGLIDGEVGKALKVGKIRAINPEHLIAIQRHDELEHILSVIKGVEIYRITASRMAKRRSREARIRFREERFREYFRDCRAIKLSLKKVECFYNRRPFDIDKADFKSGTLTGINHDEDTIALGVLEGIEGDNVLITTPLKSSSSINRIVFGEITLTGQVL
jgi:polynucleotide 5'-kinase involved in rRNA processing